MIVSLSAALYPHEDSWNLFLLEVESTPDKTRHLRKLDNLTFCELTKGGADTVNKMIVKYQWLHFVVCWMFSITAFILGHGKINPEIL